MPTSFYVRYASHDDPASLTYDGLNLTSFAIPVSAAVHVPVTQPVDMGSKTTTYRYFKFGYSFDRLLYNP